MSQGQNAVQYLHIGNIGNKFFESVEHIKYIGTIQVNTNLICNEIKSRLNSGNACVSLPVCYPKI